MRKRGNQMLIIDYIREKVKEFLGIQHIHKNPNDVNFQYISDEEILRISKAKEFKLWYLGEGGKIEQYYLLGESARKGLTDRNYFWSIATREAMVKSSFRHPERYHYHFSQCRWRTSNHKR